MKKKFNDTGLCVPRRHYMVDISGKIAQILRLVEDGAYFTISRPRQFGKTTTLSLLAKHLNQRKDYLALKISFEEIDSATSQNQEQFLYEFMMMVLKKSQLLNCSPLSDLIGHHADKIFWGCCAASICCAVKEKIRLFILLFSQVCMMSKP